MSSPQEKTGVSSARTSTSSSTLKIISKNIDFKSYLHITHSEDNIFDLFDSDEVLSMRYDISSDRKQLVFDYESEETKKRRLRKPRRRREPSDKSSDLPIKPSTRCFTFEEVFEGTAESQSV